MVVGKLPPWTVGLVVAAGVAPGGALGEVRDPSSRVIVDFRHRTLARFVDESKSDRVYIPCGAAHVPGFFAGLQQRGPSFGIRSVKDARPTTLPVETYLAPSALVGAAK